MSLINDALKRAKESQRKDAPSGLSPLRPVEPHHPERNSNLVLPVVIVFLIVTAFALIGLAMVKHPGKKIPAEQFAVAPVSVPKPQVVAAVPLIANVPPPTAAPKNSPAPPVATTTPVIASAPSAKPLRLQGIAYDASHPSAIIGGKAVYLGSLVDGMRVTAISPNSVTLAGGGHTKTLVVGEP